MRYRHLSLYEREQLYALRLQGKSFREIGCVLSRAHTSLSREYYRNLHRHRQEYIACVADAKAERRSVTQRYQAPLKDPKTFLYVREKLRLGWSPEIIAGRLPIDHPGQSIHHETIYRYIYNTFKTRKMQLWQHLTYHRKRRMQQVSGRKVKSSKIPNRLAITERPLEVHTRETVGHWETDLMVGKQTEPQALSVTVERKTRYSVLSLVARRGAAEKTQALIHRLSTLHPELLKSMTTDNGAENTDHTTWSTNLGSIPVFFTTPYHSWEKGSVENTIGRIRNYLPKGTSLTTQTPSSISQLERILNSTPRKCLHFKTPTEALHEQVQSTH